MAQKWTNGKRTIVVIETLGPALYVEAHDDDGGVATIYNTTNEWKPVMATAAAPAAPTQQDRSALKARLKNVREDRMIVINAYKALVARKREKHLRKQTLQQLRDLVGGAYTTRARILVDNDFDGLIRHLVVVPRIAGASTDTAKSLLDRIDELEDEIVTIAAPLGLIIKVGKFPYSKHAALRIKKTRDRDARIAATNAPDALRAARERTQSEAVRTAIDSILALRNNVRVILPEPAADVDNTKAIETVVRQLVLAYIRNMASVEEMRRHTRIREPRALARVLVENPTREELFEAMVRSDFGPSASSTDIADAADLEARLAQLSGAVLIPDAKQELTRRKSRWTDAVQRDEYARTCARQATAVAQAAAFDATQGDARIAWEDLKEHYELMTSKAKARADIMHLTGVTFEPCVLAVFPHHSPWERQELEMQLQSLQVAPDTPAVRQERAEVEDELIHMDLASSGDATPDLPRSIPAHNESDDDDGVIVISDDDDNNNSSSSSRDDAAILRLETLKRDVTRALINYLEHGRDDNIPRLYADLMYQIREMEQRLGIPAGEAFFMPGPLPWE